MARSTPRQHDEETALERLAELYPLAFALASESSFRTGLALRRRESGPLSRPADPAGRPDHSVEGNSSPVQ